MENTGIAAAGEAGIGGKAGIVGTDRDGGAGGGRDGECGVCLLYTSPSPRDTR